MAQAIFTIEEVKGWSSYARFPKKYKGQLAVPTDLVGGGKKG